MLFVFVSGFCGIIVVDCVFVVGTGCQVTSVGLLLLGLLLAGF